MVDTDTGDFYDWGVPQSDYVPLAPFPTANGAKINDLYISSYNSWNNFEFLGFRLPGDINAVNFTIQLTLYFHNHRGRDFDTDDDMTDFDGLRAVATTGLDEGKRYYVAHDDDTYGYELQKTTDAESVPDIIRPTDYHVASNPFQWVKTDLFNPDKTVPMMGRLLIDNVKIAMYEIGDFDTDLVLSPLVEPPETVVYEHEVSTRNESVYTDEVMNGDAPQIMGVDYIYNGFFKLSDGTPTYRWARSGVTESRYLLDIFLEHLIAQGQLSLRILEGTGIADIQLGYINSLEDQRDDVKYRFKRFLFDDKHGAFDIEMEETVVGADGESPPTPTGILLNEDGVTPITDENGNPIYV
jgi:hypothetical protein